MIKMKTELSKYKSFFRSARFSPLIIAIFVLPMMVLFFLYLFEIITNTISLVILQYVYFVALILYTIAYVLIGKELKIRAFIIIPVLFFLVKFTYVFPIFKFVNNEYVYLLFISDVLFLLFCIFLIKYSKKFDNIPKKDGIIGIIQAVLSIFVFSTGMSFNYTEMPFFMNLLFFFAMIGVVVLIFVFYLLQFRFFTKLYKGMIVKFGK